MIVVSREMQSVFAPWRKNAYQDGVLFAILALISTMGLYLYQRRQQAHDRLMLREEGERMQVEAALQQSKDQFQRVVDLSPYAMSLVNGD